MIVLVFWVTCALLSLSICMWQRTHRGGSVNVLPDDGLPGKIGEFKEVVHHHLADHVVAGEAVKVVDAEVQLAVAQLVVRHGETEGLVKRGVEILAVHTRLELLLPLRQQVDLDVGVGGSGEVFGRQLQSPEDPHHQRLLLVVVPQGEAELPAGLHGLPGLVLAIHRLLLIEFRFYASNAGCGGLAEGHGVHAEVEAGDIHLPRQVAPERVVPDQKVKGQRNSSLIIKIQQETLLRIS